MKALLTQACGLASLFATFLSSSTSHAQLVVNIDSNAFNVAAFQANDSNLPGTSTGFGVNNANGYLAARGTGALVSSPIATANGTTTLTAETTGTPSGDGFGANAAAHSNNDPILETNLFANGPGTLGFDLLGLASLDADSVVTVTVYGIGDNFGQDSTITATFGGSSQSGSTVFNTNPNDRSDATGTVPFAQFTFTADGTTDLIDVDVAAGPGGQNRSHFSGFSVSVAAGITTLHADDFLLVSVGESSNLYGDVATHLQGLLSGASGFENAEVEILQDSRVESLADGFYDQNPEDFALRDMVAQGYRNVILIPTINTTPTGTIEFREFNGGRTNVYDDAPLDNRYFAPEVFYEGATQLSKPILNAGSTPLIFLPNNVDQDVNEFGSVMQRVANGVGLDLIPGAQAVQSAGVISNAQEQYLYACCIFTQVTGLNANDSTYTPAGIASSDATALGNTAETSLAAHAATEHYNTSYELDGAVVYRNLDLASAPFNDVIKYAYKGSSTHDFTRDRLQTIISGDPNTTSFFRKLGTRNGESFGTRYWHPDDVDPDDPQNQLARLQNSNDTNQRAFMFVSGSFAGADAQTVIDLNQANMVPFAFDWIKSFAIAPAVNGTASTIDALDFHSCSELYFNYTERGWKLIPLTIGMGRLNEAMDNFVTSDDRIHIAEPLVYMNSYMMLSSALGTEFPFPEITADDIRRGSYTSEQIRMAAEIGHDLIKELAYLSETGDFVPDSDLLITTNNLPPAKIGVECSFELSANGGDGAFTWELISDAGLPAGLSLSSDGEISGTVTSDFGTWNTAFQVTDGTGAFKKVGLQLSAIEADLLGDANDDGLVNNQDIFAFALALFNRPMYESMFPDSDPVVVLDMNCDGKFNNQDIFGFAAALGF